MQTYIALLRGINVGGHKKVPMSELRELLTKSGLENVKTYIQSGNVIFKCREIPLPQLENGIQKSIKVHFGFDVSVLVRTRKQLQIIFDDCPYPEAKKVNSYFAMLSEVPNKDLVKEAYEKTYENEEYKIQNDCLYFYCANGYGNAKFNMNYFERKLEVAATSRNYKTMVKLLSLSEN
ncbi:hypothetical protein FBALC1_02387 [Flavobacteriales bacterium ALC-1]|nr:hypothetical protein FBALC1_02387 [Flavobacteriales bacterium ALC-1]